jgi:Fe-S oxidoreductase
VVLSLLNPLDVVKVIEDNVRRYGFPFPVPREAVYSWAKPLRLPDRGSIMLYTGALYQLTPYIASIVEQLSAIEGSRVSGLALKLSGILSSLGVSRLIVRPKGDMVSVVERILTSIVSLLERAEVKVAYPYEDDMYSGVLLYDLGLDELFKEHAVKVYRALKSRGAELLVTVDPHTTHIMRSVYPRYVDGYDLEVKSYLEVLAERGVELVREPSGGKIVIHDPCLYARFENVVEQPRMLLRMAGFDVMEPRRSRKMTYCCGGPIEGLTPRMAKMIAKTRLEELREKSRTIVTLCPICYANLRAVAEGDVEVIDIALVLSGAKP